MPSLPLRKEDKAASMYATEAPCLIPRIRPTVNRSVTRKDAGPFATQSSQSACHICRSKEARYTCPHCEVPYCSVGCYREHNGPCTEAFYQERVSSVLKLETKDAAQSLKDILNRSHQELYSENIIAEDNHLDNGISEVELYRLAQAMEQSELHDDDTIDAFITPEIRAAFERAVCKGELSHVVESWHPWWIPELMASDPNDATLSLRQGKTLDERLLSIPSFKSISSSASPTLMFNMLDILASITATLRLYQGVENAIDFACPEAAYTLVSLSGVIREDARHNCTVEALVACTRSKASNQVSCGIDWTVVVEDVALLCDSQCERRYLGRALLEAIDILKAGIKYVKKQAGDFNMLRRARKKLEFYLSWSQEANLPQDLSKQIREWIGDWRSSEANDDITVLRLPSSPDRLHRTKKLAKPSSTREEPHLVEVQSNTRNAGDRPAIK